ncbi:MAG: phage-shock protein [Clostridiales bacterium]|nr:phage-shock protein [Clostridiales bacterium]MCF8023253.1 phage-shock protein [Clostridiales bacterium]
MGGQLCTLTDLLKKTLFFFESMTVEEITPYVHREILKDYSIDHVSEKVKLCLQQHPCFCHNDKKQWYLNLEGEDNNEQFYNLLLTKQKPVSLKELQKINSKKKKKKVVAEEAALISDGRFVQLNNGYWGLIEWVVENSNYTLKQLVIKALKWHPTGLSSQQLFDIVSNWKEITIHDIDEILAKFPYFEQIGEGVWCYNGQLHLTYENILKRFLTALERQRKRWHRDREYWRSQVEVLQKQLQEVKCSYKEVSAALAQKVEETNKKDSLMTSLAEKDLLLSLRKKEISRYKEHLSKSENRANSILHQCRLWVQKARNTEKENKKLQDTITQNQESLESLFTKLQQYKEKDRENKAKIAELKDMHTTRVAELQTEIVELKQKLERLQDNNQEEENKLKEEISLLSNDLKEALKVNEDLQRSLKMAHQELNRAKDEYKKMENRLKNPFIRIILKFCGLLDHKTGQAL